jgi:hypothetical protein
MTTFREQVRIDRTPRDFILYERFLGASIRRARVAIKSASRTRVHVYENCQTIDPLILHLLSSVSAYRVIIYLHLYIYISYLLSSRVHFYLNSELLTYIHQHE